jgi:hypothetical protein
MFRKSLVVLISLAFAISIAAAGENPTGSNLSASAIVEKNVAARGGLQAWRAVQTMSMAGKMGAGGNQRATLPVPPQQHGPMPAIKSLPQQRPVDEVQLPFLMELARPRKMRLELQFNGQTAIQVFDGANGWKVRPYLNRREVESYTPDEMKVASKQSDLDGPLVDYAAKGTKVELAGMEKVEDRDTYKLKMTMKDGNAMNVWIDAKTFLETKIEGQPRRLDGVYHPVEIYYRDYRPVDGLQIPFVLETKVLPVSQPGQKYVTPAVPSEKTIFEKVVVNPKLDPAHFSKPQVAPAPAPKPNAKPTPSAK